MTLPYVLIKILLNLDKDEYIYWSSLSSKKLKEELKELQFKEI